MASKKKTTPRYKAGPKKGQFKPRAAVPSKSKARKKTPSSNPTKRKKKPMAKKKTKSKCKPRSVKKQATDLMLGGAAYGYLTGSDSKIETLNVNLAKLPTIGNRDITNGIAIYFANKHLIKNKYVGNMALAALVAGATKFGQRGFSMDGEPGSIDGYGDQGGLAGFDDSIDVTEEGEELSGMMD